MDFSDGCDAMEKKKRLLVKRYDPLFAICLKGLL